jgi:VanZ family protein
MYAMTDELTQAIVGRDPEVGDFIADMIGVTVALFLMNWFFRRRSRIEIERRREPVR